MAGALGKELLQRTKKGAGEAREHHTLNSLSAEKGGKASVVVEKCLEGPNEGGEGQAVDEEEVYSHTSCLCTRYGAGGGGSIES